LALAPRTCEDCGLWVERGAWQRARELASRYMLLIGSNPVFACRANLNRSRGFDEATSPMTASRDGCTRRAWSIDWACLFVPGHSGRELCAFWAVLAALVLLVLAAPSGAFAGARVSPLDRAATRAFLEARYVYEQALIASAPASKAAEEGLASTVGGECPGVLANAPYGTLETLFESPLRSRSPRQMGEAHRESRQLGDLQGELSIALGLPLIEPDRQAARAYARAVGSLRWRNNNLTVLERTGAAELEWELRRTPPDVCADMRVWAASRYRTLSPATKALIREREGVLSPVFYVLRELLALSPTSIPCWSTRDRARGLWRGR
jgi:hypothetical protein